MADATCDRCGGEVTLSWPWARHVANNSTACPRQSDYALAGEAKD